jgi:hypothetical protein
MTPAKGALLYAIKSISPNPRILHPAPEPAFATILTFPPTAFCVSDVAPFAVIDTICVGVGLKALEASAVRFILVACPNRLFKSITELPPTSAPLLFKISVKLLV